MSSFGKEVRKALIDADMNQQRLAERVGCSAAYISSILNGNKVIPPSFMNSLESLGLMSQEILVQYYRTRGALDISGLQSNQVADLLRQIDEMRKAAAQC